MNPDEGLFSKNKDPELVPLARRMRPRSLEEFLGQTHVLGPGKPLRRFVEEGRPFSWIVFGPPGCGKSAFANILADKTQASFVTLNAVTSNLAELKSAIKQAAGDLAYEGRRTLLFIDEIHRFNRLQQDALLPAVEDGTVYLFGATTQNPGFCVNRALLSRCQLLEFRALKPDELTPLLTRALEDEERGLGTYQLEISAQASELLRELAQGDARRLLNLLELSAAASENQGLITLELVREASAGNFLPLYDRSGDNHYDVASAFIKSLRGSDPDASLYWLARMLEGGEDPNFIARRLMISASEDVGLADSGTLSVTVAAAEAVERIGLPEARIILAHATLRVALAPKSNSALTGIEAAIEDIRARGPLPVPAHLRDSRSGAGKGQSGYRYPHDYPGHWVKQAYLEAEREFYVNSKMGHEGRLAAWREAIEKSDEIDTGSNI